LSFKYHYYFRHEINFVVSCKVTVLSTLDLSFNRLTEMSNYGMASVGRLDVSYNTLEKIDDAALSGLHHSLSELDVGYNRLTQLGGSVLRYASSLLVLDLRHNYLGPKLGGYLASSSSSVTADSFASPSAANLFQVGLRNTGWTPKVTPLAELYGRVSIVSRHSTHLTFVCTPSIVDPAVFLTHFHTSYVYSICNIFYFVIIVHKLICLPLHVHGCASAINKEI